MVENAEVKKKNSFFEIAYKIYHFVAKVLLYSILIILILVAIGFAAYFVDLQRNLKKGINKSPLLGAYIIISPSMDPTIKVEDAIIILREEPTDLKVGDIITFLSSDPRYSGLTITHRIVGIEKSENGDLFFRTKGDNNNAEDSALVSSKNIFGRVILKIPKIGYIQSLLMQSYGWVLLVVVPCLGIVIYDIIKLIKSIKESIVKKDVPIPEKEQIELIESDKQDSTPVNDYVQNSNINDRNSHSDEQLNLSTTNNIRENKTQDDDIEII